MAKEPTGLQIILHRSWCLLTSDTGHFYNNTGIKLSYPSCPQTLFSGGTKIHAASVSQNKRKAELGELTENKS